MNNNISIIRNLSTLGIVFHHVICAFYGVSGGIKIGSSLPVVFSDITDVVRNISMSAFTFVSGYVLWYQVNKKETFHIFIFKKIKRILLPCIFFSIAFFILFPQFINGKDPINGTHLWYLPMLFICILCTSLHIFYKKISFFVVILLYVFAYTLARCIEVRFLYTLYMYFPVFYVGFLFNKYQIENRIYIRWHTLLGFFVFINSLCFSIFSVPHFQILVFLTLPIGVYFMISGCFRNSRNSKFSYLVTKYSFSIYLLHPFIIDFIELHIDLSRINPYYTILLYILPAFFCPILITVIYEFFASNISMYILKFRLKSKNE